MRALALNAILVMLCAAFAVGYISRCKTAYKAYIGSNVAADLRSNYTAALSLDPYMKDGVLRLVPGVSTPPVFAWLRASIAILGAEDYETFESRYKLLWPILCPLILCGLVGCTLFSKFAMGEKSPKLADCGKSDLRRDPGTYGMLAVVVLLIFVPAEFRDWLYGNTSIFVSLLFMTQIALSSWKSDLSRFLQGGLISTAWWLKPNLLLVLICIFVFSLRRKEYAYVIGMATAAMIVVISSFLSPNIDLQTYITFAFDVSKTIQTQALKNSGNLSFVRIGIFASSSQYIQLCFLLCSIILISVFAGKGSGSLIQQEAACFFLTVLPWPIFWSHYLSSVALALWLFIFQMLREGKHPYLETILVAGLAWRVFIYMDPIGVNIILIILLVLYGRKFQMDRIWEGGR